jgi:hypothetical protein
MGAPGHCGQPMYQDVRDGTDMLRWLCAVPGCNACIASDTLATMREMSWADEHGILLPGVTIINPAVATAIVADCPDHGPHPHDGTRCVHCMVCADRMRP